MIVNPLSRLSSIKLKLSIVIVAAVIVTLGVNEIGLALNFRAGFRAGVAAVLALAMVQLLARGMTSPLRSMERAATAMASGDLSVRVTSHSSDEVGRLAAAFNNMADELTEVDRQRRELVANVSHELRTPISALRATLENVVDGVVEPEPTLLRTMLAQTERLQRLVTQLLRTPGSASEMAGGFTSGAITAGGAAASAATSSAVASPVVAASAGASAAALSAGIASAGISSTSSRNSVPLRACWNLPSGPNKS